VDNRALAQVFAQIADLLEIKGENAFKIRAYRSAAETLGDHPDAVARLDLQQLRELPGIGKDLAAKIRELVETGACAYHAECGELASCTSRILRASTRNRCAIFPWIDIGM